MPLAAVVRVGRPSLVGTHASPDTSWKIRKYEELLPFLVTWMMIGEFRAAAASMQLLAVEDEVTFTAGMANSSFFAAWKSSITCVENKPAQIHIQQYTSHDGQHGRVWQNENVRQGGAGSAEIYKKKVFSALAAVHRV